jgi:hypothetical protein
MIQIQVILKQGMISLWELLDLDLYAAGAENGDLQGYEPLWAGPILGMQDYLR